MAWKSHEEIGEWLNSANLVSSILLNIVQFVDDNNS
jgi:hypothetical protein